MSEDYRLYADLAGWWPLISPAAEYAEEAAFIAGLLGMAEGGGREVLELGSGGGSLASHLAGAFRLTLADLSPEMLAVSRQLNPDAAHHQGDMRTLRLGATFDAVLVHDAVDYMLTEADLRLAIDTAYEHCRPGGVAVFVPDQVREIYQPDTGCGGGDEDGTGRAARFLSWAWDPDPADTWTQTDYVYLLREPGVALRTVQESHRLGLFGVENWLSLLAGAGFEAEALQEQTSEERTPRVIFAARRPDARQPTAR